MLDVARRRPAVAFQRIVHPKMRQSTSREVGNEKPKPPAGRSEGEKEQEVREITTP